MFSFFKRAKKDDSNGINENRKKGDKGIKTNNDKSALTNTPSEMCKNKVTQSTPFKGGNVNVIPCVATEFRLRENNEGTAVVCSDEVTAKNISEKNEKFDARGNLPEPPVINMDARQNFANGMLNRTPSQITSYASAVKNDHEQRRSSVKPCGHGTLAIAPKIPIKRDMIGETPPSSPDLEASARHKYRRVHSYEHSPLHPTDSSINNLKTSLTDHPINKTEKSKIILRANLSHPPPKISPNNESKVFVNGFENDAAKKNLINQEAKFQNQLNDLSKQLSMRDAEANKLRFQMEELQRDVFAKSAGMDRLQVELQAALKESENFRQRLKHVEDDLESSSQKNCDLSTEITQKTERFHTFQSNTNTKINELQFTIRGLRVKIESLEIQLEVLEKEKENLEKQKVALVQQRDEDKKTLDAALEKAIQDKTSIEEKWKLDFEKLRTVGIVKEQELLDDFEWKLRQIEQSCKKRLQDKDKKIEDQLQEVFKDANKKVEQAEKMMKEVENLKSYECQVKQLRGLTEEQQKSLDTVSRQLQEMKHTEQNLKDESKKLRTMVDLEKENLQHMQRMHNREIIDKEKSLKEKLAEQKTAIAIYWEERLLQECRRLKSELDQLHYEERYAAIETVKSAHETDINDLKEGYEKRILEYVREVNYLKKSLKEKDEYYQKQTERIQTSSDRDIMELRRVMDKIDMSHHERFEKLVQQHEEEIEKVNSEHEKQMKDAENNWQMQLCSMRTTVELVKEQMEHESQEKIQNLIDQHRAELDAQWDNLIRQKNEAIILVEEEYVSKLKTLEEQFYTQQKSHQSREVELLKAIDFLKNEIVSKDSAIGDLQSNVDTLEGGIQVLNQEMAYHGETVNKTKIEADHKIRGLHETITKLEDQHKKGQEEQKASFHNTEKELQGKIDHLERKCQCLTKLFEEIRSRYEKRESRQEDLNTISDLRQVIAEQERDVTCLTEEKRYFQMKLMTLEQILNQANIKNVTGELCSSVNSQINVPPTIPECEDDFEDAVA